jgi:enoyl-CoA hydratase/carnithine racemase
MNALNLALVRALTDALDRVEEDPEIRVLLITGSGPAFCAGADLKEAFSGAPASGESDFLSLASGMMQRLRTLPKPVIAVLNGITMAGGLELAMCADLILAADGAKIADAHANYGVFPGAGGAAIIPRLLPLPTALYMLYTGKPLTATRLHELGLVSEVHPAEQLAAAALELANQLAAKSPAVLRRMKEVARSSTDKTLADALQHEQTVFRAHLASADFREGLAAFAEKRTPKFTGH